MVRAANAPGKTTECKFLHQRLGKLLPIKRKPTSAREVDLNNKIAEFYNILIKSDTLPQLSNKHSGLNHTLNTVTTSDIGMQCFEELIAQRRQTAFTSWDFSKKKNKFFKQQKKISSRWYRKQHEHLTRITRIASHHRYYGLYSSPLFRFRRSYQSLW